MRILKLSITKKDLGVLSENELKFFIQAGGILNEINILHKITVFSNKDQSNEIERIAQNSQSLFFIFILAGKLLEGYEFLKKEYFATKLSKHYHHHLSPDATECLGKIKAYFNLKPA